MLRFPLWWYSAGAKRAFGFCKRLFNHAEQSLAARLWLKNIFVPMYGMKDLQGKIMSFFVRLANVIVRGLGLLIVLGIIAILYLLWLIWPLFILFRLFESLLS